MNNEAIAVKRSLHGPQIVLKVNHLATQAYFPIIAVHGKEVGVCIKSHVKLNTNTLCLVSVKQYVVYSSLVLTCDVTSFGLKIVVSCLAVKSCTIIK